MMRDFESLVTTAVSVDVAVDVMGTQADKRASTDAWRREGSMGMF
jgi:hypothetical protein